MTSIRFVWLAVLTMMAALMLSGTVLAEGEVPPAVPEEEPADVIILPTETPLPVEETPVLTEPVPAEAPALEEEPAVLIVEEPPAESASGAAEILPQDEGALVDTEGEALDMASTESAEVLENSDPYFSVGITKYCFVPLAGTCDSSCNYCIKDAYPIQASINYIQANGTVPTDGCIYAEKAAYSGSVIVDGNLEYLDSVTGLMGLESSGLFPTIGGSLSLKNLDKGFNLAKFNIIGGVTIADSSGIFIVDTVTGSLTMTNVVSNNNLTPGIQPNGNGITVLYHKGNISMSNITANQNVNGGILVVTSYASNVTLTGGLFENNGNSGISIQTQGNVTIDDVISQNNYSGINIYGSSSLTISNADIYGNYNTGISVYAPGKPVRLENIIVNNNGEGSTENGVIWLWNVGPVIVKNVEASYNHRDGFYISSSGSINMSSIKAFENDHDGIDIISSNGAISLNGVIANGNGSIGIKVESHGPLTLRNIIANNNDLVGLDSSHHSGSALVEDVMANDNKSWGVNISSAPGVAVGSLRDITANHNGSGGISVNSGGGVVMTNISTNNNLAANYFPGNGLTLHAMGIITVTNISADLNQGEGVFINSNSAIKIIGLKAFDNDKNGLYIHSKGSITIVSINANNNGFSGADLDNCQFDISTSQCLGTSGISVRNVSGTLNELSSNGHFGLWATSKGAIIVTNLRADENDSDGAFLRSDTSISVNTLGTQHNNFSHNGLYQIFTPPAGDYYQVLRNGLSALSLGNISVSNTDANWNENGGGGILLANYFSTTPRTVTVTNCSADNNNWVGLWAESRGSITLTNVSANSNGFDGGIYLDNCEDWINDVDNICAGSGIIKLSNVSADNNGGQGLSAFSKAAIFAKDIAANGNRDTGLTLFNRFNGATAGITLNFARADGNGNSGISIDTSGALILANINASGNIKLVGDIENESTVQDFYNHEKGMDKWWFEAEEGAQYIIKLQADGYSSDFGTLLNRYPFDPKMELYDSEGTLVANAGCITNDYCLIDWTPGIGEDGSYYLLVGSSSTDGFYRLSINDPTPSGAATSRFWVNGISFSSGNVTLSGVNFINDNQQAGFNGWSGGSVSISNITANANGCEGIYINKPSGNGNLTLAGLNVASWNGWEGLLIDNGGAVNISNLNASNNGQDGVKINATSLQTFKTVTLSNVIAMYNGMSGLQLDTAYITTLNNVRAWFNDLDGVKVDTHGYRLTLLNSSCILNGDNGFEYAGYFPPLFVFTNTNNILMGNTGEDLLVTY